MKEKLFILATLLGMITLSSCSEDEPSWGADVPNKVQQEFKTRYPGISDVHWDVVSNYHVARFNAPKTRAAESAPTYDTNVWFTQSGQFCQTDEDIAFDKLPQAVQDGFNAYMAVMLYEGFVVDECEILSREGMGTIYVIEIENESTDQEREISISEFGDVLKDVLDDDNEDEILPVLIPNEVYAALEKVFPETHSLLTILELDIDDDEIEVDVMESDRHKEVKFDGQYNLINIEYDATFAEAKNLIAEDVLLKLTEMAKAAGIDLNNEEVQKEIEIEVKQTATGFSFEVEIKVDGNKIEVEIDENGQMKIKE